MITSRSNRRLKDMRRLKTSKGDRGLLDGPHLVAEAVEAGIELVEVVATPAFLASPAGRKLAALLPAAPAEIEPRLLASLADADSPQGVLAIARLPRGGVEELPIVPGGLYLLAEGIQDPGNLGALARVVEAAGGAALALTPGSVHPNHPRALRASAGSLLRLPVALATDPEELGRRLAPVAPRRLALVPRGGMDLWTLELEEPAPAVVLTLGAEGPGLSAALAATSETAVTIPLAAPVESLNLATAAAVALFELARRRAR